MKAIRFEKFGGPEVLEYKDIEIGKPGPKEVLVKNLSVGLNYIDVYHRTGLYPIELPSGLGLEASGVVEEIGSEVSLFKVGDRVSHASAPISGYSEKQIMPEEKLVTVPEGISDEIASCILLKGITSEYLLHRSYAVKKGDKVLFHAAAGGVGQIFAQWANSIGAKVIGTVGSDEKIDIAKENGYAHVINYTKNNFSKEVMKITNNQGVPAVFDGVGKKTFQDSLACLKIRGMMVSFGNASGPLDPVNVPKDIQPKGLYLTRPSIGQYFSNRKELQDGADQIFEKVKFGKIKVKIFRRYRLSDAKQAHADLEARKLAGPAVLIP